MPLCGHDGECTDETMCSDEGACGPDGGTCGTAGGPLRMRQTTQPMAIGPGAKRAKGLMREPGGRSTHAAMCAMIRWVVIEVAPGLLHLHICDYCNRERGRESDKCARSSDRIVPSRTDEVGMLGSLLAHDPSAISETDKDGNTALHYAAYRGNLMAAEMLCKDGVDMEAKNTAGNTAMDFATWIPNSAMVRCLTTMKRKYQHRNRRLQKSLSPAPEGEDVEASTAQTIKPGVVEEDWHTYFKQHAEHNKKSFLKVCGDTSVKPQETMQSRVAGMDGRMRVNIMYHHAELAGKQ